MSQSGRLDVFEIHEFVGQGGMAEAWRGRHVLEDVPVAVKFIVDRQRGEASANLEMLDEIRAVARLNHPGVVTVLDAGFVTPEIEEFTQRRVRQGSVYLAMEFVSGTLMDVSDELLTWEEQRQLLRQILEALAHSHARGVIHRDLKPENVLLDSQRTVKLTDFGLADALNAAEVSGGRESDILGTPQFMAPEQVEGSWREQGPWTDLYALGCLAYWLASGVAPFEGEDPKEICRAQRHRRPAPLRAKVDLPLDFQEWLDGLLEKKPEKRYRTAADALHDLMAIDTDVGLGFDATLATEDSVDDEFAEVAMADTEAAMAPSYPDEPAPLPGDWREERRAPQPTKLVGVGRGLYELRSLPLVGRQQERDLLWKRLREVEQSGRPQAILLRGERGTGTSRLARWVGERAHETAGLTILEGAHRAYRFRSGICDGVTCMLVNHLRLSGLVGEELNKRIDELSQPGEALEGLGSYERGVLRDLLAPVADPENRFEESPSAVVEARKARVVLGRVLAMLARRRPVVLILDDVQCSEDTLKLVEEILERGQEGDVPIFFVMTAPRKDSSDGSPIGDLLSGLSRRDDVEELAVEPLDDEAHVELVEYTLRLEPSLAAQVVRRTAGYPLFSVELVGDWIRRDLLEVTPAGFVLRDESEAALPNSIHHLLRRRIDRFVDDVGERRAGDVRQALEVAAALGEQVLFREWWTACRLAGLMVPESLLEELLAWHLANSTPTGWAFHHGALRESLVRMARNAGRWQEHNMHCAKMIATLYGDDKGRSAHRRAHHLAEAKQYEATLEPLLEAAHYCMEANQLQQGHELFGQFHEMLDRVDVDDKELYRVRAWQKQIPAYGRQGRLREARDLLRRSEEVLAEKDWEDESAELAYHQAWILHLGGDPKASEDKSAEALQKFSKVGDRKGLANTHYLRGLTANWRGDWEAIGHHHQRAYQLYEELGDEPGRAKSLLGRGSYHSECGDFDVAIELSEEAVEIYEELGDEYCLGIAYSNLGDVYRDQGDLERAQNLYEKGIAVLERVDLKEASIELNLSCVLLQREEYEEAMTHLGELLVRVRKSEQLGLLGIIYASMLPCHAADGDWERWDESMALSAGYLRENSIINKSLAWTFEHAGQVAREAGEWKRARSAYTQARSQWKALGNEEKVDEIKALMEIGKAEV